MHVAFNLAAELQTHLIQASTVAGHGMFLEVQTSDPRHGDFQVNGVLGYAKKNKLVPHEVANKIIGYLANHIRESYEITVSGPGFINFTLKPTALHSWLHLYGTEAKIKQGAATAHSGQTWVVDYSSPNTAKQMHVGHLRSAVIGEAICRLLEFTGATVIRDNHLGDWGTQFGKLIWAQKYALQTQEEIDRFAREPIEAMEELYRKGHTAAEADPAIMEQARQELVKLQNDDPTNVMLWQNLSAWSLAAFQQIYDRLGITFKHNYGESFYKDKVGRVYTELIDTKIAENSDGALVVFHDEHPRFSRNTERPNPFMVRKADGASGYASTDLATALYRTEHFKADGIVVVTDFRQSDHFEQLFLTVKKWFAAKGYRLPELHHVTFGAVTGEDGRALKTRDGGVIKLKTLLDEAEERAYAIVNAKNAERPEADRFGDDECRAIARVVGIASVQYADLSQNRSSNYVFSWDKMLALDGNTAPYLLYAGARIHSIFRKLGGTPGHAATESAASALETPSELALARKLVKFADAIRLATESLRPHFLTLYLYELAGEFSAFYAADKVAVEDPAIRARRLMLCARTLLLLETGLGLLGLRTLKRM